MLQVPGIQSTIKIGHDKYGLPYLTASSRELPALTIAFAYAAGYDFRLIARSYSLFRFTTEAVSVCCASQGRISASVRDICMQWVGCGSSLFILH